MKYRAEIDGLRALAVLPVIFFHAGFELFRGGFVGVDVFFVISGYLITAILIDEIQDGRFSIFSFYERRARRLLPALVFMVLTCLFIGWFVLTPYFYRDLFQTTLSISFFASNLLLFLKSGYFTAVSELKPFLHTWSLAVEEQYYVVFPVFLLLTWRFGQRRVIQIIILLALASLLVSEWGWRNNPSATFYLTHSRAWELLAGSLAAFTVSRRDVRSHNVLALSGLVAIIVSIFFYDESTPFPSIYTLVPVLGTVLIVLYADKHTIVAKILSTKFLVGIGLISYSAYLWHQPVFAFSRHLTLGELTYLQHVCAIFVILACSILSWRYIELPFRDKNVFSRKTVFVSSSLALTGLALIGFFGHMKLGFPERFSIATQQIAKGSFDKNPRQNECFYLARLNSINSACILGDETIKPTIALIGDSHGEMFAHSLDNAFFKKGLSAYNLTFLGCKPVNFVEKKFEYVENPCFESVSTFLSEHDEVTTLIVSFRWTAAIKGVERDHDGLSSKSVISSDSVIKKRGEIFARKIEELVGPEHSLIIIYPVPEAGVDVPNFIVKRRIISDAEFTVRIPYSDYVDRNQEVYSVLDSINVEKEITRIYPSDLLCADSLGGFCETVINDYSVYYDDNHLSNYGASIIIPEIASVISN